MKHQGEKKIENTGYFPKAMKPKTYNPPKPNPLHFQAMPGISLTVCSQRSEPQLLQNYFLSAPQMSGTILI